MIFELINSRAFAQHSVTRTKNFSTRARPAPAPCTTRIRPAESSTRPAPVPHPHVTAPQMRVPATRPAQDSNTCCMLSYFMTNTRVRLLTSLGNCIDTTLGGKVYKVLEKSTKLTQCEGSCIRCTKRIICPTGDVSIGTEQKCIVNRKCRRNLTTWNGIWAQVKGY